MNEKATKRAWETPELVTLGDLESLTAAGLNATPDGGLGGS